METLDEPLEWLHSETRLESGCACGIFDATNTTKACREKVRQRIAREQPPVRLIFVESVCDDTVILDNNYRMKLSNDDYKGVDPEEALRDLPRGCGSMSCVREGGRRPRVPPLDTDGQAHRKASRSRIR